MQAVLGRGRIGRSLAPNLARDAWGERFHWGSTAGLGSLGLPGPAPRHRPARNGPSSAHAAQCRRTPKPKPLTPRQGFVHLLDSSPCRGSLLAGVCHTAGLVPRQILLQGFVPRQVSVPLNGEPLAGLQAAARGSARNQPRLANPGTARQPDTQPLQ